MLKNSIVVVLFIALLILGGIYGQLLTLLWTYLIDIVSRYWMFILIICGVVWFVKDRTATNK